MPPAFYSCQAAAVAYSSRTSLFIYFLVNLKGARHNNVLNKLLALTPQRHSEIRTECIILRCTSKKPERSVRRAAARSSAVGMFFSSIRIRDSKLGRARRNLPKYKKKGNKRRLWVFGYTLSRLFTVSQNALLTWHLSRSYTLRQPRRSLITPMHIFLRRVSPSVNAFSAK